MPRKNHQEGVEDLVQPTNKDIVFIKIAKTIAELSKCVSHQVGCIIVKDDRIISMGYNGTPAKYTNCNEKFSTYTSREEHHKWSKTHEIHAELNAILYAAKNGISIELWIKFDESYNRRKTYELVSNTLGDRGKGFRLRISWGKIGIFSGEGGANGKTWGAFSKSARQIIKPGIWYHIAGTYDGSVFKIYLDGVLVGESAENLDLTKGGDDIYIGSYKSGYAYGMEGIVDEVKLYNRPLSESEIFNHYKQ